MTLSQNKIDILFHVLFDATKKPLKIELTLTT